MIAYYHCIYGPQKEACLALSRKETRVAYIIQ